MIESIIFFACFDQILVFKLTNPKIQYGFSYST